MPQAHTDTERLDWVMDVLSLTDNDCADAKVMKIVGAALLGKAGREAIDAAMDAE